MSITVVGSVNLDLVVKVKSMVAPGETILAQEYQHFPGGKGANQALACTRLGGETRLIGKSGDDANADMALSLLSESGCQLNVGRLQGVGTGLAIIMLDESGENSIVVSPGANHLWPETDEQIADMLEGTTIVVLQLEIPVDVVKRVLTIANSMGIKTVLNPSPVNAQIKEVLPLVDVLLMNETEAQQFTAQPATNTEDYAQTIRSLGAGDTVVTLGPEGALIIARDSIEHVPAQTVKVVDTTAAGDTYTGALVSRMFAGDSLLSAAKYASHAAALAVGTLGAQPSIPYHKDVELVINNHPSS